MTTTDHAGIVAPARCTPTLERQFASLAQGRVRPTAEPQINPAAVDSTPPHPLPGAACQHPESQPVQVPVDTRRCRSNACGGQILGQFRTPLRPTVGRNTRQYEASACNGQRVIKHLLTSVLCYKSQRIATSCNTRVMRNVDPHMTLGQLVGRLVKEGLDRHDPARPPRRARRPAGSRATGAGRSPAPKHEAPPAGGAAPTRNASMIHTATAASPATAEAASACNSTPAPKPPRDTQARTPSVMQRPAQPAGSPPSAPKPLRDMQAPAPSNSGPSARPAGANASEATSRTSSRATPAAVRWETWQHDGGRCSYADPRTGQRCASRHLPEESAGGASMRAERSRPTRIPEDPRGPLMRLRRRSSTQQDRDSETSASFGA